MGYSGNSHNSGYNYYHGLDRGGYYKRDREEYQGFQQKKCYVYNQPGYWFNKHTLDKRKKAYSRFRQQT
jgi:hypothetical protein